MDPTQSRQHWLVSVPFPEPETERQSPENLLWQLLAHLPAVLDKSFSETYTALLFLLRQNPARKL